MTTLTAPVVDVHGVRVPVGLHIDGAWRPAGTTFAVHNPADGSVLAEVADADLTDAVAALDAAAAAQKGWAATSARTRSDLLRAAFDEILRRGDDFARIISAEMGKPLAEARGEVAYGTEFFRWFADQATQRRGDSRPAPSGAFDIIVREVPVGPCLLITPWNFPLAMGTRKVGAALAAGCTVVLKPAAQTPLTMALLVEVLESVGVPAGVVNLVPTVDAAAQSSALMSDPRLRKVSFTGSTAVGSTLLRQAADRVLRTSMELGGNGPFLVLADADLDAAVEGAMVAKFRNGGQSCVAANRLLVHRDIADEFTTRFSRAVSTLVAGPGLDPRSTIGPLIDERQRDRVADLVTDAVDTGARVVVGGRVVPGAGAFYEPTVLVDVPTDARLASEEIFGPVAAITVVDSDDEAVARANDTEFGLAAFVYSASVDHAMAVGSRLEAGMVGINRGLVSEPSAPFGGVKASGLGREGGHEGIAEYLETTYFAVSPGGEVSTG